MSDNGRKQWQLERIALEEIEGSGDDVECGAIQALRQSNREILETLPVTTVVAEIQRRHRLQQGRISVSAHRQRWWWIPTTGALVALVALFLFSRTAVDGVKGTVESVRSKGDIRLLIAMKSAGGSIELAAGDSVSAGSLLQLSYLSSGQRYGIIVSIDGRGEITQHLPEEGANAAELTTDGRTYLPSSYELDDAPQYEQFYFVASNRDFEMAMVREAVQKRPEIHGPLSLGTSFQQTVFVLRKVSP